MRMSISGSVVVLALVMVPSAPSSVVAADAPHGASEQSLSEIVRRTILDGLPREFAGDNDWGQKRAVASGLKFRTGSGRLRIEKRTKEVNDGLWTQYRVVLVDPTQHLRVHVADLRRVGAGRVAFQLFLSARLEGEARYERWRRGIKMLNFKADAQTTVEAALDCEVGLRPVPGRFLSDLLVEVKVNGVKLSLVDIDLARVSRIDGPAAEELGDRLRHTLDKELRSREDEIGQKLNEALRKDPERLRFSMEPLLATGWDKARALLATFALPSDGVAPR